MSDERFHSLDGIFFPFYDRTMVAILQQIADRDHTSSGIVSP